MESTALHAYFDGLVTRSSGATCGHAEPTTRGRQKNRCAVVPKRGTLATPYYKAYISTYNAESTYQAGRALNTQRSQVSHILE